MRRAVPGSGGGSRGSGLRWESGYACTGGRRGCAQTPEGWKGSVFWGIFQKGMVLCAYVHMCPRATAPPLAIRSEGKRCSLRGAAPPRAPPPQHTHTGQGRRSCGSARVMGHERGFRCRAEGSRGACWRSIRFSCDQAAARAASPRKGQAWGAAGPGPGSHATGGPSQGLINSDDCGCPEIPAIRRRLCRRGGGRHPTRPLCSLTR